MNTLLKPKNRLLYVDLLRAFAIFTMVIIHVIYQLGFIFLDLWQDLGFNTNENILLFCAKCADFHFSNEAFLLNMLFCSGIFMFLSGYSTNLSSRLYIKALKLSILALLITLFTSIASEILNVEMTIKFGIIHFFAIATFLAILLKKSNSITLILFIIVTFTLGSIMRLTEVDNSFLAILGFYDSTFVTADYYPIFPNIAIFATGMLYGRTIKFKPINLSVGEQRLPALIRPIAFLGRNSLKVYVTHIFIIALILFPIGLI